MSSQMLRKKAQGLYEQQEAKAKQPSQQMAKQVKTGYAEQQEKVQGTNAAQNRAARGNLARKRPNYGSAVKRRLGKAINTSQKSTKPTFFKK